MRGRDFENFILRKFILRLQVNKCDSNKLLEGNDWLWNGLVSNPTFATFSLSSNFWPGPCPGRHGPFPGPGRPRPPKTWIEPL